MEEILVKAATESAGGFPRLIASIFIVGTALIVVNVLSHAFIEWLRRISCRRELVERNLKLVVDSASALLSRICDILVTYPDEMKKVIDAYSPEQSRQRRAQLIPISMNRHESTAYRLICFLAAVKYFERQTAETSSFPQLERIHQYLHHKIPVVLRGNLYGYKLLETEMQEELATAFLDSNISACAGDLSVSQFCKVVKDQDDKYALFDKALQFFCASVPISTQLECNRLTDNQDSKHFMVLAQLGVYLADFCQDFGRTSQWEEYRLLFVCFIKQWNKTCMKKRYLYEPGDIGTDNYLRSFPGRLSPLGLLENVGRRILFVPWLIRQAEHVWKLIALNIRGGRSMRRHDLKALRTFGLKIKVMEEWMSFRWNDDLPEVYSAVQNYSKHRIVR